MQKDKWYIYLVTELNKLGTFFCRLGKKCTIVAEDTDWVAVNRRPTTNQRWSIQGLELFKVGTVSNSADDFSNIKR